MVSSGNDSDSMELYDVSAAWGSIGYKIGL